MIRSQSEVSQNSQQKSARVKVSWIGRMGATKALRTPRKTTRHQCLGSRYRHRHCYHHYHPHPCRHLENYLLMRSLRAHPIPHAVRSCHTTRTWGLSARWYKSALPAETVQFPPSLKDGGIWSHEDVWKRHYCQLTEKVLA
jgi:hypothetical protein